MFGLAPPSLPGFVAPDVVALLGSQLEKKLLSAAESGSSIGLSPSSSMEGGFGGGGGAGAGLSET